MKSITEGYSISRRINRLAITLLAILIPFLFSSCASQEVKQPYGPAFNYTALTTTLQKGVSDAADVRGALGEPNGSGGYEFPIITGANTIWFYEKMKLEIIDMSSQNFDIQQDVLIVFFKEERFDGFLWFSDAHKDW